MKFTASRLSDNNKVFPAEIHIEELGITVKIPGFFRGKTEYFDFTKISNVSVVTPLIGYSTITFSAAGSKVSAHGFKKSEVLRIKKAIADGKRSVSMPAKNRKEPVKEVVYKKYLEPTQVAAKPNHFVSKLDKKKLKTELIERENELLRDRLILEEQAQNLKERKEREKLLLNIQLTEQLRKEAEIQQDRVKQIQHEKDMLIERHKVSGHLIVFWKYVLDRPWKKIVVGYIALVILISLIALIQEFLQSIF